MLLISECIARAALEREESRGGHTRDDFPQMSPEWRKVNLICSLGGGAAPNGVAEHGVAEHGVAEHGVVLKRQQLEPMRADLFRLFDRDELKKYVTAEELAAVPEAAPAQVDTATAQEKGQ